LIIYKNVYTDTAKLTIGMCIMKKFVDKRSSFMKIVHALTLDKCPSCKVNAYRDAATWREGKCESCGHTVPPETSPEECNA
jgi:hypothetical protein